MVARKAQQAFAPEDVPVKFDDACIEKLASIGRLPKGADRQRFAESVREAARIYARNARNQSGNEVRDEVGKLYRAASRREYERAAHLLETLSPQARPLLEARASTPGFKKAKLKMPTAKALRDPSGREQACDVIRRFCSLGGSHVQGRKRRSGKRSITWKPLLWAPQPIDHPPRLEADRHFVMLLQLAWLEAVGKSPTATVNPSRSDRPFVNMVGKSLTLIGSPADAVGIINELRKRQRTLTRRRERNKTPRLA